MQDIIVCALGAVLLVSTIEWIARHYIQRYKDKRSSRIDIKTRIKMNRRYSHNHKAVI